MNRSPLDGRTTASLGTACVRPTLIADDEQLPFASDADTIEARI